mmetsp:Transcript_173945/g.423096  ORF Transcript_173945/g.423096 Transcript_173945/m.423096 type:complete len:616 (+) Transcript_173945:96-1943(+)
MSPARQLLLLAAAVFIPAASEAGGKILEGLQAVLSEREAKAIQSGVGALKEALRPIATSMPRNDQGKMAIPVVRYALHRLFMRRGWSVRGLEPAGQSWSQGSPTEMLGEGMPGQVLELFDVKLRTQGLDLEEAALLAATFHIVVRAERIQRLQSAFRAHSLQRGAALDEESAHRVLDTYLASYVLGRNLTELSEWEVHGLEMRAADVYGNWEQIQKLARDTKRKLVGNGVVSFSGLKRILEEVDERVGPSENSECQARKHDLMAIEHRGSGRVRLSDFYKANLHEGKWHFGESTGYLRQLGALDESNPSDLQVIIANYVNSKSNCIDPSKSYSVCCLNECDELLGQLESTLASPSATPSEIAQLVAAMPSATVPANRTLPASLLRRLQEVTEGNGGRVPIHGRLFAQWMHHAYPHECPYPHEGGVNPQTPDEWLQGEGQEQEARASEAEVRKLIGECANSGADGAPCRAHASAAAELPWSDAEVLLARGPSGTAGPVPWEVLAKAVLFVVLLTVMNLHKSGYFHDGSRSKKRMARNLDFADFDDFDGDFEKPGKGAQRWQQWMVVLALVSVCTILEAMGWLDRFSFCVMLSFGLLLNVALPLMIHRTSKPRKCLN